MVIAYWKVMINLSNDAYVARLKYL